MPMSKSQQKKARKREAKLLYQLAELHRRRAACSVFLARLYEVKARNAFVTPATLQRSEDA